MTTMKVIKFPTKELVTTVELSYSVSGESSYQKLKDMNEDEAREVLSKAVSEFEIACKKRLEEIKKTIEENEDDERTIINRAGIKRNPRRRKQKSFRV